MNFYHEVSNDILCVLAPSPFLRQLSLTTQSEVDPPSTFSHNLVLFAS